MTTSSSLTLRDFSSETLKKYTALARKRATLSKRLDKLEAEILANEEALDALFVPSTPSK